MSKRTRGSRPTHRRPGTRPTSDRTAGPVRAPRTELPPTVQDEPRPDRTEGTALATVTPSTALAAPARHARARAKPGSVLAARAATEYVYVGQDLRRILVVAALLLGVLVALWVVLVVMGLSPLY